MTATNTAPILHLNLTKEWYDAIKSRKKPEEYRSLKPYFDRIFQNGHIKIKGKYYHPTDVVVCFSNGYSKDRPQMFWTLKDLVIREGNPNWGAKLLRQYYCLLLKNQIQSPGCGCDCKNLITCEKHFIED